MGSKIPLSRKQQRKPGEQTGATTGQSGNEGEGNKTADRNYRKATQDFVESERGRREIGKAGNVSPQEEAKIRQAEEEAKEHAKEHDPTEISDRSKPA